MDPQTSSPSPDSLNLNRIWINDPLAIWEQWVVLTFGLLAGVALFEPPSHQEDRSKVYGFLLFVIAGLLLACALLALRLPTDIFARRSAPADPIASDQG